MEKKQGFTHDNKNNMTVDWYTPPSIFEMLNVDFVWLNPHYGEHTSDWLKRIANGIMNMLQKQMGFFSWKVV